MRGGGEAGGRAVVFDTSEEGKSVILFYYFFLRGGGGLYCACGNAVMQSALRRCEGAVSERMQKNNNWNEGSDDTAGLSLSFSGC